jgi:hypothetical protein
MKNILAKLLLLAMTSSLFLLILLLQYTTPSRAGATGILCVFILAYIFIVSVLSFLMYGISRIIVKVSRLFTVRRPLEVMSLKRAYYFSSVVGLAPVILVSMQSVGSFGLYEFGLVALLVVIGCVYITKRTV